MASKELTEERKRVERIVSDLQDYWNTYTNQEYYRDYEDEIIIDDSLYGLGVALDPEKYKGPHGYLEFKKQLWIKLSNDKSLNADFDSDAE